MKKNVIHFAELSMDQIRMAINDALQSLYGKDECCWVRDMYPEFVVVERDGKLWKFTYTVSGTDVTIGNTPTEVTQEYVPATTTMGALEEQYVEIFRAGDYGPKKGSYTAEDLVQLAASYTKDDAPVVVGHPKLNAPAFGWVEQLKVDGDTLLAKFHQVEPNFETAVKEGRYKKRSVAMSRGEDGALRLHHVGFLGAMPPEVKGLADVQFGGHVFTEIDFNEEDVMLQPADKKSLLEAMKEFFGGETPKVFTEAEVATRVEAATKPLQDKINAFEASRTAATEKAKTFAQVAKDKIAEITKLGKWLPAFDNMKLPEVFAALASSETVITFGEGEAKKDKPVIDVFTEFMANLPKLVPDGKLITDPATPAAKPVTFNAAPGIELDQDSVLFAEACTKRASEKNITFSAAMKQLTDEGWKPAGTTATGAV